MTSKSLGELLQQQVAEHIIYEHFSINPHATCTELAENAAAYLNHDEWLDDPNHWIWDLALEIGDQA